MSAMTGEGRGQLDIGRVIQQLFAVLGRNFATFFLLSLILTGAPAVIVGLINLNLIEHARFFGWQSGFAGIVSLVTGLVLQGTIIFGTVSDLNGRRVSLAECLSVGLRTFLPLLAIAIMMGVALFCGFLLLIVPGIMMAVAWSVTVPVYVVEQTEVFSAFTRSADLTRGHRWRIFGLFVIYLVAIIIVEMVTSAFGGVTSLLGGGPMAAARLVLFVPLVSVVNSLVGAVGVAVLYVELRRLRDGVDPAGLAAIFD